MEVSEAASARAAPATNESNKRPAAALSRAGTAVAMSAASSLFAWLAARTLRRCGAMDEEEVLSAVLWRLSPLISAYLFSWTVALSPPPRAKVVAGGVLARVTCLLLVLGFPADRLIAPFAGAAAIVLAPLLSACACGRALAESLQRAGTERWSAATVAATPIYQSREEERERREHKAHAVTALSIVATVFPVSLFIVSWVSPRTPRLEAPPTDVVFFLAGPAFLAARLMERCMVGNPVLAVVDDMRGLAAMAGVIGWLVVVALANALFGTIAWTVVVWMGELGMVGLLGYFLAVDAHYEQLMAIERKKPRRAKDASGLLDGRDSGDACSAHIDTDGGGICVCALPRRCECK